MTKTLIGIMIASLSILAMSMLASCGSSNSGPTSLTVTVYHLAKADQPGVGPIYVVKGSTDPHYIALQWHVSDANLVNRFYQITLKLPSGKEPAAQLFGQYWTLYTFHRDNQTVLQISSGPKFDNNILFADQPNHITDPFPDSRSANSSNEWVHIYLQILRSLPSFVNPTYAAGATPLPYEDPGIHS